MRILLFLGLDPSVDLIFSSLAIYGLGNAMMQVRIRLMLRSPPKRLSWCLSLQISSFSRVHSAVVEAGFDDDINTYLIITGTIVGIAILL